MATDAHALVDHKRTHWSSRAARRVIAGLIQVGGSATSMELAREIDAVAVSTDIHAARCWLAALGFVSDREGDPIHTADEGRNRQGRRVYRYTLRLDVMAAFAAKIMGDE